MTLNELNQLISADGEEGLATAICIVVLLFIVVFAVRHLLAQLAIFLIVGTGIVTGFDRLVKTCHPDIFPKGSASREWADTAQKLYSRWMETKAHSAPTRQHLIWDGRTGPYRLINRVGSGDLCDVYQAANDAEDVVLKIPRHDGGNNLLAKECQVLEQLTAQSRGDHYHRYFPRPIESFLVGGRRVNAYRWQNGFYTAEQIIRRYPNGLDGRHIAWMFNRTLEAIGFAHNKGWLHGAVLPPHLMFHVERHGLQLVGWIHAERPGRPLSVAPAKYMNWYPPECQRREPASQSVDIYLAAKSMVFLAGGNPRTNEIPNLIPKAIRQFLTGCLLESPNMRPRDAWNLHEEFNDLLEDVYGPPKYHHLSMS